jgi:phage gp29-like protein
MSDEAISTEKEDKKAKVKVQGGSSGTFYSLGLIGAWIYYIGRATTTQGKIKGFFKGLIWPVMFVYQMLEFLNKE